MVEHLDVPGAQRVAEGVVCAACLLQIDLPGVVPLDRVGGGHRLAGPPHHHAPQPSHHALCAVPFSHASHPRGIEDVVLLEKLVAKPGDHAPGEREPGRAKRVDDL